jgi:anthranilate phosphoribosyltransferase
LAEFKAVWLGEKQHEYGEMAVTETIGIALYTMGICEQYEEAMQQAKRLWQNRLH